MISFDHLWLSACYFGSPSLRSPYMDGRDESRCVILTLLNCGKSVQPLATHVTVVWDPTDLMVRNSILSWGISDSSHEAEKWHGANISNWYFTYVAQINSGLTEPNLLHYMLESVIITYSLTALPLYGMTRLLWKSAVISSFTEGSEEPTKVSRATSKYTIPLKFSNLYE